MQSETHVLANPESILASFIAERKQLSPIHVGPSPTYHLSDVLLCQVLARVQINPHRSEARKHSLRLFGLGSLVQPQKGTYLLEKACIDFC